MPIHSSRSQMPWIEIRNFRPSLSSTFWRPRRASRVNAAINNKKSDNGINQCTPLKYTQVDQWQRENKYILTGYRPASGSYISSIKSIGWVHNETVNILSHLFGTIAFFLLPLYVFDTDSFRIPTAGIADFVVFSTFALGVAVCFLLSTVHHTLANHSAAVSGLSLQYDFIGIVVLMWGCTLPSVYYGFYCDPHLQKFYWTLITILSTACIAAILDPRFGQPKFRPWRISMFMGIGVSSFMFMAHGLLKYGWETQRMRMSLDWMALSFTFNTVGALCFAFRIPERWNPGRYDIIGSSHQILHFMVIFAGIAHYYGLIRAFDHVHRASDICLAS